MSVYLAKLYKFSVEAGVDHDVAEAAAPPPPASEALAVELQRLVPGPRHGPVLSLKNGDLRLLLQKGPSEGSKSRRQPLLGLLGPMGPSPG